MRLADAVVVVTGGASGIGAALVRRFVAEGAAAVVVADLDEAGARRVAEETGAEAHGIDVTDESAVATLIRDVLDRHGRVDLYCSNAGIATGTGLETSAADWSRSWAVNVMAHVYAARAVLPSMVERGSGHLLLTCSAAGLLTAVGDVPYTVSKHAAVAFAEWLSIMYGDQGIGVSALCPLAVETPMYTAGLASGHVLSRVMAANALLQPDDVAEAVVSGLAGGRFLILPHPEVADYYRGKAADPEGWLAALRRVVRKLAG